jgi:hypothetical protein
MRGIAMVYQFAKPLAGLLQELDSRGPGAPQGPGQSAGPRSVYCQEAVTDEGLQHRTVLTGLQSLSLHCDSSLTGKGSERSSGLTALKELNLHVTSRIQMRVWSI